MSTTKWASSINTFDYLIRVSNISSSLTYWTISCNLRGSSITCTRMQSISRLRVIQLRLSSNSLRPIHPRRASQTISQPSRNQDTRNLLRTSSDIVSWRRRVREEQFGSGELATLGRQHCWRWSVRSSTLSTTLRLVLSLTSTMTKSNRHHSLS